MAVDKSRLGDSFQGKDPGSGGYFKPADHAGAWALIVEVEEFREQQPGYAPNDPPRDIAVITVTSFASQQEAEAGIGKILPGQLVANKALAGSLRTRVGKIEIYKLAKQPSNKGNDAWIWKSPPPEVAPVIIKYLEERDNTEAPSEW